MKPSSPTAPARAYSDPLPSRKAPQQPVTQRYINQARDSFFRGASLTARVLFGSGRANPWNGGLCSYVHRRGLVGTTLDLVGGAAGAAIGAGIGVAVSALVRAQPTASDQVGAKAIPRWLTHAAATSALAARIGMTLGLSVASLVSQILLAAFAILTKICFGALGLAAIAAGACERLATRAAHRGQPSPWPTRTHAPEVVHRGAGLAA